MENVWLFDLVPARNLEDLLTRKEIDVVCGVDGLGHAIYLMRNYGRRFSYLFFKFQDTIPGLPLLNSEKSSISSTL